MTATRSSSWVRALIMAISIGACTRGGDASRATGSVRRDSSAAHDGNSAGTAGATSIPSQTPSSTSHASPSDARPGSEPWTAVAAGQACGLYAADPSALPAGQRQWASCGTGCRVAEVSPFGDGRPSLRSASAAVVDGNMFVRVVLGYPSKRVVHVSRLSDDATIAVVEQRSGLGSCLVVGGGANAPLLVPFVGSELGIVVGRADSSPGKPVAWPSVATARPAAPTTVFPYRSGWGMTFADATVRTANALDAAPSTIDSASTPSYHSSSTGDAAIWSFLEGAHEVIRGTTGTAPPWTWASEGDDIHVPALSDKGLVWIGVGGSQSRDGYYNLAAFHWAARPTSGQKATSGGAIPIPANTGLLSLQAGGDFVATLGCTASDANPVCALFVANISSKRLWTIASRKGSGWSDVLAVSADEILLGEVDAPSADPAIGQQIQRLVRLSVSDLDALSKTQ